MIVDINPVPLRLSKEDINTAIQNISDENQLKLTKTAPVAQTNTPDVTLPLPQDDVQADDPPTPVKTTEPKSSAATVDTSTSEPKGKLRVKNYGLKK